MAKLEAAQDLPPRASYSQLSTAQRCSFKYWLTYMAGIERVEPSVPLVKGRLLHEAYDAFLFNGHDSKAAYETLTAQARQAVDEGSDSGNVAEIVEACVEVLDAFLPWSIENDTFEVVLPEPGQEKCETSTYYDLKLPDGSTWPMHYKIDAHIIMDGTRLLLENKFKSKLDANGLEHDLQILLYQAFWNEQHPEDQIAGVVYNVVGPRPRKKDGAIVLRETFYRGRADQRIGLRNAAAMVMTLRSQAGLGFWPMNQRKECNWDCEYVGMCLGLRSGGKASDYINGSDYRVSERHLERREQPEIESQEVDAPF